MVPTDGPIESFLARSFTTAEGDQIRIFAFRLDSPDDAPPFFAAFCRCEENYTDEWGLWATGTIYGGIEHDDDDRLEAFERYAMKEWPHDEDIHRHLRVRLNVLGGHDWKEIIDAPVRAMMVQDIWSETLDEDTKRWIAQAELEGLRVLKRHKKGRLK